MVHKQAFLVRPPLLSQVIFAFMLLQTTPLLIRAQIYANDIVLALFETLDDSFSLIKETIDDFVC